jgi:hypothetical protein
MKDTKIKKIPYGVANYERVVQKNCYYVDKTMYLRTVEESDDYLFFIRPRRFGKSLFLSVRKPIMRCLSCLCLFFDLR